MIKKCFIAFLLLILFGLPIQALPFGRTTGLIDIPVAMVLEPLEFRLSAATAYIPYIIEDWRSLESRENYNFTIGLFKNFEASVTAFVSAIGKEYVTSSLAWRARVANVTTAYALKIRDETKYFPALAIGAQNIGGNKSLFVLANQDPNSYYIVATKNFGDLGIMHLGVGKGRFEGDEIYSRGISGMFFGWEKEFIINERSLILASEVDGRDINVGAKYRFMDEYTFLFALCELDNWVFPRPYPWDPVAKYQTVRAVLGIEYKRARASITVTAPKDKTITRSQSVVVQGKTEGIVSVEIRGVKVKVSDNKFNLPVDLDIGINNIEIRGKTNGGRVVLENIRVLRLKTFPDVPNTYWAVKPIEYLATLGVIKGFPDKKFKSKNKLTRAEFSTLLVRTKGEVTTEAGSNFSDVPATHWATSFINASEKEGLVKGYPNGTFRPNNNISRAEGIAVISRFDGLETGGEFLQIFADVPKTHWAASSVFSVTQSGILEYLKGKLFLDPNRKLYRDEAAELISKTEFGKESITWMLSFGEKGKKPNTVNWKAK